MASATMLCKKILNVKGVKVENCTLREDEFGVQHLDLDVRPTKRAECRCPVCHRKCPKEGFSVRKGREWRGVDFGSLPVHLKGYIQRIKCPEHGSVVADVPWAYPGSRFTKDFDLTVGWRYTFPRAPLPNTCASTGRPVGRCVDPFHVVEWATEAVDEVRRAVWRDAYNKVRGLEADVDQGPGRPKQDDEASAMLTAAKREASELKHSSYALGKAPEHLTDNQKIQLEMIAQKNPTLYRAYKIKESLRLLLKLDDVDEAA